MGIRLLTMEFTSTLMEVDYHLRDRKMKHTFTLEYWQDDGWYVGKLQEIPGIFSQGETMEELEANIEDAYELSSMISNRL